jgi:Ras-related C3 botulinum toxin substrate 1
MSCAFMGDASVGKSEILEALAAFDTEQSQVSGALVYSAELHVDDAATGIEFWELSAKDECARLRRVLLPLMDVFFLCYSVVDRESFDNIRTEYAALLRHALPTSKKPLVFVVATHTDQRHDSKVADVVSTLDGEQLTQSIGATSLIECNCLQPDTFMQTLVDSVVFAAGLKLRRESGSGRLLDTTTVISPRSNNNNNNNTTSISSDTTDESNVVERNNTTSSKSSSSSKASSKSSSSSSKTSSRKRKHSEVDSTSEPSKRCKRSRSSSVATSRPRTRSTSSSAKQATSSDENGDSLNIKIIQAPAKDSSSATNVHHRAILGQDNAISLPDAIKQRANRLYAKSPDASSANKADARVERMRNAMAKAHNKPVE